MGQITATRNLVATKVVRLAGQWETVIHSRGLWEEKPCQHSYHMGSWNWWSICLCKNTLYQFVNEEKMHWSFLLTFQEAGSPQSPGNLLIPFHVVVTGYKQCSKLLPVRQPEADNFGGGLGTFFKLFFNFMFMIWDSRPQDWQLFWLSFEHWYKLFKRRFLFQVILHVY